MILLPLVLGVVVTAANGDKPACTHECNIAQKGMRKQWFLQVKVNGRGAKRRHKSVPKKWFGPFRTSREAYFKCEKWQEEMREEDYKRSVK